ncbi:hypothetical protein BDZ89DRAFT_1143078 [Hymenopellis radicata]|nr:hypothetical protein BDZ89DRAFT_1143078 [Hymenopellis radicata]
MAHMTLPQEIIDAIVDDVALLQDFGDVYSIAEGIPALYSCSLTCRALLPRARKHIFRQIMLSPEPPEYGRSSLKHRSSFPYQPTCSRFMKYVPPSTAALVESLILSGQRPTSSDPDPDPYIDLEEWAASENSLPRLMASLQSLNAVDIRWFILSSPHVTTLHSIFTHRNIRSAAFSDIYTEDLDKILLLFPHMQSLRYGDNVWDTGHTGPGTVHGYRLPSPECITLSMTPMEVRTEELFRLISRPVLQLNRVKRLECRIPFYGRDELLRLTELIHGLEHLVHLEIGSEQFDPRVDQYPALPFHRLTSLAISASLPFEYNLTAEIVPFPWKLYLRSLSLPYHAYHLQDFHLTLSFEADLALRTDGDWRDLARVLLRLPNLRCVYIVLVAYWENEAIKTRCVSLYESITASLEEEGHEFHSLLVNADVSLTLVRSMMNLKIPSTRIFSRLDTRTKI